MATSSPAACAGCAQSVARRHSGRAPRARVSARAIRRRSSLVPGRDVLRGNDDRDGRAGARLDLLDRVVDARRGQCAACESPTSASAIAAPATPRDDVAGGGTAQRGTVERELGHRDAPAARAVDRARAGRPPAPSARSAIPSPRPRAARCARAAGSRPAVLDLDADSSVRRAAAHDDLAAAVLDRVREQVPERLGQPARIGTRPARPPAGQSKVTRPPRRSAAGCQRLGAASEQLLQVERRRPCPRAAPAGGRGRVVGSDLHPAQLGRERLGAPPRRGLAPQRLEPERDRGERSAELVGRVGDQRRARRRSSSSKRGRDAPARDGERDRHSASVRR